MMHTVGLSPKGLDVGMFVYCRSRVPLVAFSACLLTLVVAAQNPAPSIPVSDPIAAASSPAPAPSLKQYMVPPGTILRMELSGPVNVSHLKPGSELAGQLARPVYVYDRALIPAGSQVHIVVEKVEKERAPEKKGLMERVDTVRSLGLNHHNFYEVSLRAATLKLPSGVDVPMELRFIRGGQEVLLQANQEGQMKVGGATSKDLAQHAPGVSQVTKFKHGKQQAQEYLHPVATLEVASAVNLELPAQPEVPRVTGKPVTIPEGTHANFLLLTELSASDNKQGDTFQARLVKPIFQPDGKLLVPEGSLLEGHIARLVPPRRMSRAASLYLVFDRLTEPEGNSQRVSASLAGADVDKKAPVNMDTEGGLHGKSGAKSLAKRAVVGVASQQIADEVVEMATHAVAPYASTALGLFILFGGHGNDVDLPRYSDLEVVFGRPLTVPEPAATPTANQPAEPGSNPPQMHFPDLSPD